MGILHGHRRSRQAHAGGDSRYYPTMRLLREGVDDAPTRYEPESLAQRTADPYEEWRAKRDAEGQRGRVEAVRWVYRQRGMTATATNRETAAAEAARWVNRYKGTGASAGREAPGAGEAGPGSGHPADLVGAHGG